MPAKPSRMPLADLVSRARTAVTNARADAEVAAALAPFGIDAPRLDALLDLVEDVEARMGAQASEYAEQYAATSAASAARADLDALYARHRQLARLVHPRGGDAYRSLSLGGTPPDGTPALLAAADVFYRVLATTPALVSPLARYRVDAAALAAGQAKVEALRAAVAAQARETGDAQRATAVRDDAANRLRAAYGDLVTVARMALADLPQARERLGLLERS